MLADFAHGYALILAVQSVLENFTLDRLLRALQTVAVAVLLKAASRLRSERIADSVTTFDVSIPLRD